VKTAEEIISFLSINSPKIYPQIDYVYGDNIIEIKAPQSINACSAIIYILPNETLQDSSSSKDPKIRIYHSKNQYFDYDIVKEKPEGGLTKATTGDIVANRLALLRINPANRNQMILINPVINTGAVLTDVVLNNAVFTNRPKMRYDDGSDVEFITETEIKELSNEMSATYQPAMIVSTLPIETYLKGGGQIEDGQIYVQTEA
jgi:hypothetical protein